MDNETIKIWLDDRRKPSNDYFWCNSANEAKAKVEECEKRGIKIELIDTDYDLGDYEFQGGSGYTFIKWLHNRGTHYSVNVHSTHVTGRGLIEDYIKKNWA